MLEGPLFTCNHCKDEANVDKRRACAPHAPIYDIILYILYTVVYFDSVFLKLLSIP